MLKLLVAIMLTFAVVSCKQRHVENLRSVPEAQRSAEARLAEGQVMGAGGKGSDEQEADQGKNPKEDNEAGNDNSEYNLDPDATPEDHHHVDLEKCFQTMPKDRDPGPFFREEKVVKGWGRKRQEHIVLIPIDPPPPGLSICKTIMDECIICESWGAIYPQGPENEEKCDEHAATCTTELGKECRCVRS